MGENTIRVKHTLQFCTFWLGERLFGVDILDVKEVDSEVNFTPIFHSSEKVCGYVNIRGNIHLVIDMRKLMGFENKKPDGNSRVILFKSSIGESFGVLVDRVGDVVDVEEDKIENRRQNDDNPSDGKDRRMESELGMGVYKLEKNLLVILNARNFLKSIRK